MSYEVFNPLGLAQVDVIKRQADRRGVEALEMPW